IGVVGGSILLVLIVITTLIEYWPRQLKVPKAEHISKFVEAARQKLAPPPPPIDSTGEAEAREPPATESPATASSAEPVAAGARAASAPAKSPAGRTKTASTSRFEPLPIPTDAIIIKLERTER